MTVLVTGATGFVGRHVVRALASRGLRARALVHQRPLSTDAHAEAMFGDLRAPATLDAACADVQCVVHLASIVADDDATCEAINVRGTENLLAACRARGVRNVVYLGNSAVCGYNIQRDVTEDAAKAAPATPVSRSRLAAEARVLAIGGCSLRTLFTYGEGDTYFVPRLMRTLARLPFLVAGGRARLSLIGADQLAERVATVVSSLISGARTLEGQVFHVNDGEPTSLRAVVDVLVRELGLRRPRVSLPYAVTRALMRIAPGTGPWTESAAHRLYLVSVDHTFDASRIARAVGPLADSGGFRDRFARHAAWYREVLA
jgi:nucleoside-diphosphate-sugar epimerase